MARAAVKAKPAKSKAAAKPAAKPAKRALHAVPRRAEPFALTGPRKVEV